MLNKNDDKFLIMINKEIRIFHFLINQGVTMMMKNWVSMMVDLNCCRWFEGNIIQWFV